MQTQIHGGKHNLEKETRNISIGRCFLRLLFCFCVHTGSILLTAAVCTTRGITKQTAASKVVVPWLTSVVVCAPVDLGTLLEARHQPGSGRRTGIAVLSEPLGKIRTGGRR